MTVGELLEFLCYCPNEAEIIVTDSEQEFAFFVDKVVWADSSNEVILVVDSEAQEGEDDEDDTEQQVANDDKVIDVEFKVVDEPTMETNEVNNPLSSLPVAAVGKVVHDV